MTVIVVELKCMGVTGLVLLSVSECTCVQYDGVQLIVMECIFVSMSIGVMDTVEFNCG